MYISFENPVYLAFLLVIPLLILIHFYTLKSSKKKAMKFANFDAIGRVKGIDLFSKNIVVLIMGILMAACIVLALSGMTLNKTAQSSSFSFVISIDSSRSMQAEDISPNRIGAAKSTAIEFVDGLPVGTRVGVISFSGNTYMEEEITNKKGELKNSIRGVDIGSIEGTDVYEAIVTSTNMLKNEETRAIILLSDGQVNVGDIDAAVNYANKNEVMIHTIAIGTEEGGEASYGISKIDKDTLKSIAYHTGGSFFEAKNREDFTNSFNNALESTERKVAIELSAYLLLAAIIILVIKNYLLNTRYRTLP